MNVESNLRSREMKAGYDECHILKSDIILAVVSQAVSCEVLFSLSFYL